MGGRGKSTHQSILSWNQKVSWVSLSEGHFKPGISDSAQVMRLKWSIFRTEKYCYKAQKCSHKQWSEQAHITNIQAFVWCIAYEQIQPSQPRPSTIHSSKPQPEISESRGREQKRKLWSKALNLSLWSLCMFCVCVCVCVGANPEVLRGYFQQCLRDQTPAFCTGAYALWLVSPAPKWSKLLLIL